MSVTANMKVGVVSNWDDPHMNLTATYLTNTLYRFSHTLVKAGYDGNESTCTKNIMLQYNYGH